MFKGSVKGVFKSSLNHVSRLFNEILRLLQRNFFQVCFNVY